MAAEQKIARVKSARTDAEHISISYEAKAAKNHILDLHTPAVLGNSFQKDRMSKQCLFIRFPEQRRNSFALYLKP